MKRITHDPSFDVYPSLSADGVKLLYLSNRNGYNSPRLLDLRTGAESAVIHSSQDEMWPRISPDGSKVAFAELRINHYEHFYTPSGGGKIEVLCEDCGPVISDWTKDSRNVLIDLVSPQRLRTVGLLKLESRGRIQILQHGRYNLLQARFSPD